MRQRGRLTEWNDERGFGFVTSLDDESRAFVHISAFPSALRRPMALDLLTYQTTRDDRGRLQAMSVEFLAPVAHKGGSRPDVSVIEVPVLLPLGVLGAVLLAAVLVDVTLGLTLLLGYAAISLVTFASYAADKSAAKSGRFRTQESALHLLEVVGGWPGALIAQRVFRHKTVKRSFQIAFWSCVLANIGALIVTVAYFAAVPG